MTHCHELGGLKQQEFILSRFWRPAVRNQGVGRVGSAADSELSHSVPLSQLLMAAGSAFPPASASVLHHLLLSVLVSLLLSPF